MQVKVFEYLTELKGAGSINKAAKNLFLSQQGLNRALTSLESELGVPLFELSHAGVSFTKAGHAALEHGRVIFNECEALIADIEKIKNEDAPLKGECRPIVLVVSPYASLTLLSEVFSLLDAAEVSVREWNNDRIKEALAEGRRLSGNESEKSSVFRLFLFDWLKSEWPIPASPEAGVQVDVLFESRLGLVCRSSSALGKRASITPEAACDIPLVCFNGQDYLKTMDAAFGVKSLTNAVLKVSDRRTILSFVAKRDDAGVVSDELTFALADREQQRRDFSFVPFSGIAALDVGFAYVRDDLSVGAYRRFIAMFREACRNALR